MTARLSLLLLALAAGNAPAADYYLHPELGDDRNAGTSAEAPWQSLDKVGALRLAAGDRVLLAAGQTFTEELRLKNVAGSGTEPILVTSYAAGGDEGMAATPINLP